MQASRQDQGHTASFHYSKPILTLDTNSSSNLATHNNPAQSAPVGTRQEKGIPPLYQATDRYCAKLEEMMNSPTWRSQNPGPHVTKDAAIRSRNMDNDNDQRQPSCCEDATSNPSLKKNIFHASQVSGQPGQDPYDGQYNADKIHLGHDSESIKVHSIYPFPAIPRTSTKTFIIAASVSRDAAHPQVNPSEEVQGIRITEMRYNSESDNAEKPGILDTAQQDNDMNDQEKRTPSSSQYGNSPDDDRPFFEAKSRQLREDANGIMKLDQLIESIDRWPHRPHRRHQASPDGEQRFRGLLERLKLQDQIEHKPVTDAVLRDPAIVKIGPSTPTDRSKHTQSDSGYVSGVVSRPSTRAQSRATIGTSDSVGSEVLSIQDKGNGSNDPGFESPSKNSSLNPAAQEFSSAKNRHSSPIKTSDLPHANVSGKPFLPHHQGMPCLFPPPQVDAPSNQSTGVWYPPLADDNNLPMVGFSPIRQEAFPILPGAPLHPSTYTGAMMPPPLGTNPHLAPALPSFSGLSPGMAPPFGLGVPGNAQSISLAAPSLVGAFHQQLPYSISCNNPNHHTLMPLGGQPLPTAMTMDVAPQNAAGSIHAGPPHFIPKHVPKPKVPDRDLQQNWELMHELRRMHEPGYAQKCKEKQRKRFMKQLEKRNQP